jgi:hypothetical protein
MRSFTSLLQTATLQVSGFIIVMFIPSGSVKKYALCIQCTYFSRLGCLSINFEAVDFLVLEILLVVYRCTVAQLHNTELDFSAHPPQVDWPIPASGLPSAMRHTRGCTGHILAPWKFTVVRVCMWQFSNYEIHYVSFKS